MKARDYLVLVTTALLVIVASSYVYGTASDQTTVTLNVGNADPTIVDVSPETPIDLLSCTTAVARINFTVEDSNGPDDINLSTAAVYVNKSGEVTRFNSSGDCEDLGDSGNQKTIRCGVTFQFYDSAGVWQINATVCDNSGSCTDDISTTLTLNSLDSIELNDTALDCGSTLVPGSTDNICEDLEAQNCGNQDYSAFNETSYDVDLDSNPSEIIGAGNFSVNATAQAPGTTLVDSTAVDVADASSTRGAASFQNFYHDVDIPSGAASGGYTSTSDWIIEAIQ